MDYIEQMKNLRAAFRLISEKLPEIQRLSEERRMRERDEDLKIITMSDMEFHILEREWDEVEEKLRNFDYEEDQYGKVDTLSKSEMRGFQ